jgi:hypothetical protein
LNSILQFFCPSLSLSLFAFQSKWKIKFKTRKTEKLRLKGWKKSVETLKRGKKKLSSDGGKWSEEMKKDEGIFIMT